MTRRSLESPGPSPQRPNRHTGLNVLAWVLFAAGLVGMLGVVMISLLSEGDGDYRTWETIRLHVRLVWSTGALAIGGPMIVWLIERGLDRRGRLNHLKKAKSRDELLE